jgi:Kef-type K+ transport system membrane component KefB
MKKMTKYILVALLMLLVANLVIMGLIAALGLPNIIGYILVIVCAWQIGAWVGRRI